MSRIDRLRKEMDRMVLHYINRCVAILVEEQNNVCKVSISISGYNFKDEALKNQYRYYDNHHELVEGFLFETKEWNKVKFIASKLFKIPQIMISRSLNAETPTYFLDHLCMFRLPSKMYFGDYFTSQRSDVYGEIPVFDNQVKRVFSCAERKINRIICENNNMNKTLIISKPPCDLCKPFIKEWYAKNVAIKF